MSDIGDSRVENILEAGIEGEPYEGRPQSRVEELLKELIESGGGTVPIDPSESEIESYPDGKTWIKDIGDGFYIFYVKINGDDYPITKIDKMKPYSLCFSSDEDFTLSSVNPGWDGVLEYSTNDGLIWTTWDGSELSGTAKRPIRLRGIGNTKIAWYESTAHPAVYHTFAFTGKYCTGNIETLLDYQTVANGQHPTMGNDCYSFMFRNCASLEMTPELPAVVLTERCYQGMFYGCRALTEAPELPATTLAVSCYQSMFENCKALTEAPELPVTDLAERCYANMFYDCRALTKAPELPATTLAWRCYESMFNGCLALTEAPELPATNLVEGCYSNMFYGCRALTEAPELPATVLAVSCYQSMFENCAALTEVPELPATVLAQNCYRGMFKYCTSMVLPSALPAMTVPGSAYYEMYRYCTALNTLPKLPATNLVALCYAAMFSDCTSIKVSEDQSAVYRYMFRMPSNPESEIYDLPPDGTIGMLSYTGGPFTGDTTEFNKYYYTDHEPIG